MKRRKILIISLLINILFVGVFYSFIKKDYINNERIIIKPMTETGNESQIEELNKSYQNYREYIDSSKKQLATAITNKGVETTSDSTLETMTANVNKIVTNPPASLISYDNTSSGLSATNIQGAVDELHSEIEEIYDNLRSPILSISRDYVISPPTEDNSVVEIEYDMTDLIPDYCYPYPQITSVEVLYSDSYSYQQVTVTQMYGLKGTAKIMCSTKGIDAKIRYTILLYKKDAV